MKEVPKDWITLASFEKGPGGFDVDLMRLPDNFDAQIFAVNEHRIAGDQVLIFALVTRVPNMPTVNPFVIVRERGSSSTDTHWLGEIITLLNLDRYPHHHAEVLWSLENVFGFDLQREAFIGVQFKLRIPVVVPDGFVKSFKKQHQDLFLNLDSVSSLDSENIQVRNVIRSVLKALSDADVGLYVSSRNPEPRDYAFDVLYQYREPFKIGYRYGLWEIFEQHRSRMGDEEPHPDLFTALKNALILMEQSEFDQWWKNNVDDLVKDPTILVDIDIEPYLLLEEPTPYMLPYDEFVTFLRGLP